jgi:hypothetical protein
MPLHFTAANATFIHIPKNAGNSLEKWALDNNIEFEDKFNHCTASQAKTLWNDLGYVFSFVRNPFSRTVSIFHYLGQHAEQKILSKRSIDILDDIKTVKLYKKGFDYWLNCMYDYHMQKNREFNEKLIISMENGMSFWPRRAAQNFWLNDKIDLIIKVENLDKEFYKVKEILNSSSNIPLEYINTSTHHHYTEYYNDQNKRIIEDMFKEDLDRFNYNF